MIRFLVIAVMAVLALPLMLRFLGPSVVVFAIVAIAVILVMLSSPKRRGAVVMLAAVLWLAWSFLYPMYQAARKATADGQQKRGQIWAAMKEAGKVAAEKLVGRVFGLPKVGGAAIGVAQGVNEAAEELTIAEQLCLTMPFVKSKFGDDGGTTMYCQKQDVGVPQRLKAYLAGGFTGGAGPLLPFIVDDPSRLDLDKTYFDCLRDVAAQSFPESQPCFDSAILAAPHKWRLCVELAIQVRYDDLNVRAPLAPEITACRMKAKLARGVSTGPTHILLWDSQGL